LGPIESFSDPVFFFENLNILKQIYAKNLPEKKNDFHIFKGKNDQKHWLIFSCGRVDNHFGYITKLKKKNSQAHYWYSHLPLVNNRHKVKVLNQGDSTSL
jgi:hypothetical protein